MAQQAADSSEAKPAPREERSLDVYKVERGLTEDRVVALKDVLQSVFPEAKVQYDAKERTLVVLGTPEVQSLAKELLKKLDAPPKKAAPEEGPIVRAYALKYADPHALLRAMSELLPREGVKLAADERTRTIIVSAPREMYEKVEELVKMLDVEEEGDQIKIFELVRIPAGSAMQMLRQLPVGQKVGMAVAPESNLLVVSGPPKDLNIIEAVLLRLDERSRADKKGDKKPSPEEFVKALRKSPRRPGAFRVRVAWLVSGVPEDVGTEPSSDLKNAVKRLSEMEAGALRQVGQVIVSTGAEGEFQVSCTPVVSQADCQWDIHGEIHAEGSTARLGFELSAMRRVSLDQPRGASRVDRIFQLETKTVAPYGQPVVLCAAPIDGQTTSILLVQVTPSGG